MTCATGSTRTLHVCMYVHYYYYYYYIHVCTFMCVLCVVSCTRVPKWYTPPTPFLNSNSSPPLTLTPTSPFCSSAARQPLRRPLGTFVTFTENYPIKIVFEYYKASKTGFFSIGYFSFKSTLKCFKAIPTIKYLNANPAFNGKNKSSSLMFLSIRCNVY